MYNLTLLGVLSTLNPGVVDERCAFSVHWFDLFGETINNGRHTLYLGSDTECMIERSDRPLSILAQNVGAIPLPESRQTLKCCATTLPIVCHFHHTGYELMTNQGTDD